MSRRITVRGGNVAIDNCMRRVCDGHTASCGSSGVVLREPPTLIDAADFPQPVSAKRPSSSPAQSDNSVTDIFPSDAKSRRIKKNPVRKLRNI